MDTITFLLFIIGLVFLIFGADFLVGGASRIAASLGISPLIIGLTVVAFGTSAPEIAVSVMSSFKGQGDIAFGNVLGSNLCNILLILGASAAVSPLIVHQKLVRIDVNVMIAASLLMVGLAWDGSLGRWDGLILALSLAAYLIFSIREAKKERQAEVLKEYEEEFGLKDKQTPLAWSGLKVLIGLVLLVLGSRWLVNGAVSFAKLLGVSELIIGLTVVALGTSLPELATSMMASYKGERDIAAGNIVGSNIFNLLAVLGIAGLVSPNVIPVASSTFYFDIPLMLAASFACLPIFFTGYRIARWEGFLLLGYYFAYLTYVVLKAQEHDLLPAFNKVMFYFVIPLTVVTFVIVFYRYWKNGDLGKEMSHVNGKSEKHI